MGNDIKNFTVVDGQHVDGFEKRLAMPKNTLVTSDVQAIVPMLELPTDGARHGVNKALMLKERNGGK